MVVDDIATIINSLITAVEAIEQELGLTPSGVYADVRARLDILEARINTPLVPIPNVTNPFFIGNTGVTISVGNGFPTENRADGSLYLRSDGYLGLGLYSRQNGTWFAVNTGGFYSTTNIDNTNSPYSSTLDDVVIAVDSTAAPVVINLVSNPGLGISVIVKDEFGQSGTNTITVNGNGHNIDGASSLIINANFASVTLVFLGIRWGVI